MDKLILNAKPLLWFDKDYRVTEKRGYYFNGLQAYRSAKEISPAT